MGRQRPRAGGTGLAARPANGRGVPRLRLSALRYPLYGVRRVRNQHCERIVRRDAPRGNEDAWMNNGDTRNNDVEVYADHSLRHGRDIGERSDAVLRTAMPCHDEL